jgi:CBS domain-containing protein
MDANPTVLHPDSTIATAMRYVMQHRYRNLPVVEPDSGKLVGVISYLRRD